MEISERFLFQQTAISNARTVVCMRGAWSVLGLKQRFSALDLVRNYGAETNCCCSTRKLYSPFS